MDGSLPSSRPPHPVAAQLPVHPTRSPLPFVTPPGQPSRSSPHPVASQLPGIFDTYSSSSPIIRSVSSESVAVRASDNHSWPAQDRGRTSSYGAAQLVYAFQEARMAPLIFRSFARSADVGDGDCDGDAAHHRTAATIATTIEGMEGPWACRRRSVLTPDRSERLAVPAVEKNERVVPAFSASIRGLYVPIYWIIVMVP